MKYELLLLRLGEIVLKGRNRNRFEKRMAEQIRIALRPFPEASLKSTFGRIYVELGGEDHRSVIESLQTVFGVLSLSPVLRTEPTLEAIREGTLAVMQNTKGKPATFKVSVRRIWKEFPYETLELNRLIGGHVLVRHPELTVDVRKPDIELRVEIHSDHAFVYNQVIPGAGGFPYGTNGKAMLLLSGGIDSPVAGWHAMRKGLEVEAVHFYSYPFTSEQAKEKVVTLARRLSYYTGTKLRLHIVPFTDIQTAIVGAKSDSLIITLMRRAMLRIAERLAEHAGALAIVTGDSLGQVASQTLGSLNVIGRATQLPLLRPLVMMDKQEIMNTAERIGTYATSILPYEDCCTLFVPRSPSTNPNLRVVEQVESSIPELDALIDQAIQSVEVMELRPESGAEALSGAEADWF
ncbi:tRNA uracil 4-sulfurtransferase ThiI [Paenibacillus tarimensis]